MGLGYEGYVKFDGLWTLGTGTSVPRSQTRIDSQSGYAGKLAGATDMGIGAPHTYDWTAWDGSISFDLTNELFTSLKGWITSTRDAVKSILFSSRNTNVQTFSGYWNSISISASEASPVTCSVGFVALDRGSYIYGSDTQKMDSDTGGYAMVMIPYWNTSIGSYKFLEWTLDFSQDVVKLFACNKTVGPQGPVYLGVGPMSATLTGTYILGGGEMGIAPGDLTVTIGTGSIILKTTELQEQSDDVQIGNSLTPISVTVAAYELA